MIMIFSISICAPLFPTCDLRKRACVSVMACDARSALQAARLLGLWQQQQQQQQQDAGDGSREGGGISHANVGVTVSDGATCHGRVKQSPRQGSDGDVGAGACGWGQRGDGSRSTSSVGGGGSSGSSISRDENEGMRFAASTLIRQVLTAMKLAYLRSPANPGTCDTETAAARIQEVGRGGGEGHGRGEERVGALARIYLRICEQEDAEYDAMIQRYLDRVCCGRRHQEGVRQRSVIKA